MRYQTESEKLRELIPLSDRDFERCLAARGIPFERDVDGSPIVSHEGLRACAEWLANYEGYIRTFKRPGGK